MTDTEEFIEHYGKKGMRWGKRKGTSSKASKKSTTAKPKAKDLSDDALKKAVNRMQMEKQYNTLIKTTSVSKKGAAFASGMAGSVVKATVMSLATQQIASALKKK